MLPVDNYILFYIACEDPAVVTIIRVMYEGRDTDKQLRYFTKYSDNTP